MANQLAFYVSSTMQTQQNYSDVVHLITPAEFYFYKI